MRNLANSFCVCVSKFILAKKKEFLVMGTLTVITSLYSNQLVHSLESLKPLDQYSSATEPRLISYPPFFQVSELESQCTLVKNEKDLLEHRLEVANKKVEETRQEMRDMENLYSSHNTHAVTQLGDDKAIQKMKQMEFSIDLTKQKCDKAERRVKELENEMRRLEGADIRNGVLMEECDNLKQQVQQAKQLLDEKTKKLNEISIEVTQLKAHVDKLSEENKKHRCSIEKKDNKIDHLEQKLWQTEEELQLERDRGQEQQLQVKRSQKFSFEKYYKTTPLVVTLFHQTFQESFALGVYHLRSSKPEIIFAIFFIYVVTRPWMKYTRVIVFFD